MNARHRTTHPVRAAAEYALVYGAALLLFALTAIGAYTIGTWIR